MKLLVDMFACQTGSRPSSIGTYTLLLAREMAGLRGANEMIILADDLYEESFESLRQEFIRLLPIGAFLPYYHSPITYDRSQDIKPYSQIAEILVRQAYQTVSPDVVLTPNPFEGWMEKGVVPSPNNIYSTYAQATVLHDFIPYFFQQEYLDINPEYKKWYMERLNNLHKYDLLLSSSEMTRQDAIKILGVEPDRIVNISGAVSSQFRKLTLTDGEKQEFLHRLGILRPFVLCIGAGDLRKNTNGALQAYAQLPRHIIDKHQLVLIHADGEHVINQGKLASLGFLNEDVITVENINDENLVVLYNLCKLFLFPSFYEGSGLPILEAMKCGAPLIASNNSSLLEVMGRTDVLFDALSDQSIAACLYKTLTNDAFLAELSVYGLERAKQFSPKKSAQKAWDAVETMQKEKNKARKRRSTALSGEARSRIAYVSPLPPQKSEISNFSAALLPYLATHFEIDLFVEPGLNISDPFLCEHFKIYPWTELLERYDAYQTVVYCFGNAELHTHMMTLLQEMPGVVILNEFFLGNLPFVREYWGGQKGSFLKELDENHGLRGIVDVFTQGISSARAKWPMNWLTLKNAQVLIVHSDQHNDLMKRFYEHGWSPKPVLINQFNEKNDPEIIAAAFADEIHKAIEIDERKFFNPLIEALTNIDLVDHAMRLSAQKAACNMNLRCRPRVLLDVTNISKYDFNTGIQRVVKNLAREFLRSDDLSLMVEFVQVNGDQLMRASRFAENLFNLPEHSLDQDVSIIIRPGDILFMIDKSWVEYDQFSPIFERVRRSGGKILTMIYDLIPIRYPETCHPGIVSDFKKWLDGVLVQNDQLVCISSTVADDLIAYISDNRLNLPRNPDISYIHLGADIEVAPKDSNKRAIVQELAGNSEKPLFLMIGTLESRKGHTFALDAFDQLWQAGCKYRLCLCGNIGWNMAETEVRIRNHPELNNLLFFVEKPNDAEINLLYSSATALIAASIVEGFGLPIVEAALHKVPVLASDIPVFREVGGNGAMYFSLASPAFLADAVIAMELLGRDERLSMAKKIKVLTWKECAEWMLEVIEGKHMYFRRI